MKTDEWLKILVWIAGIMFGVLGTTWGFATAFADLQDEDEVKDRVDPIAVTAAENKTAVHGINVRLDGFEKAQDKLDGKMDAVLEVVLESAEYQREAAPQRARPRAKKRAKARAARVRTEAAADDGDPLAALEDL